MTDAILWYVNNTWWGACLAFFAVCSVPMIPIGLWIFGQSYPGLPPDEWPARHRKDSEAGR